MYFSITFFTWSLIPHHNHFPEIMCVCFVFFLNREDHACKQNACKDQWFHYPFISFLLLVLMLLLIIIQLILLGVVANCQRMRSMRAILLIVRTMFVSVRTMCVYIRVSCVHCACACVCHAYPCVPVRASVCVWVLAWVVHVSACMCVGDRAVQCHEVWTAAAVFFGILCHDHHRRCVPCVRFRAHSITILKMRFDSIKS